MIRGSCECSCCINCLLYQRWLAILPRTVLATFQEANRARQQPVLAVRVHGALVHGWFPEVSPTRRVGPYFKRLLYTQLCPACRYYCFREGSSFSCETVIASAAVTAPVCMPPAVTSRLLKLSKHLILFLCHVSLSGACVPAVDVQALKLSLAAGKVSPRAHRASISTFSSGPRTPTRAGSVRGESNTPGSPASIVSIGGFDGQARYSDVV